MTFTGSIKIGFNNYLTFKGRASRSEYWYWYLFVLLLSLCTQLFDVAAFPYSVWSPTNTVTSLVVLLPGWAVFVRRLHDVNRSGWWMLLVLTVIGIFVLLYWMIKNSDQGENSYGEWTPRYGKNVSNRTFVVGAVRSALKPSLFGAPEHVDIISGW